MENSIILNIVKEKDPRGHLWHYGHFIHDFILPMIALLVNNKYDHVYLLVSHPWCSLGTFLPIGEKILGLKITEIKPRETSLSLPIRTIKTLGFGPYNPIFFKSNISYIKNTLNITESPYKVILIERGESKLKNNITDTGFNRRHLNNHNQIKNVLKNKYGQLFKNVILENLSIDEQVSLFMNANIVIGQHGAGLCNIIWMNKPKPLVIEFPPYIVDTFMNMCKVKNFKYARIEPNPQRVIEVCSRRMPHIKMNNINDINIKEAC